MKVTRKISLLSALLFLITITIMICVANPAWGIAIPMGVATICVGLITSIVARNKYNEDNAWLLILFSSLAFMATCSFSYMFISGQASPTARGRLTMVWIINMFFVVSVLSLSGYVNKKRIATVFSLLSLASFIGTFIVFDIPTIIASFSRSVRLDSSIIGGNMYAMTMSIYAMFFLHKAHDNKVHRIRYLVLFAIFLVFMTLPFSRTALLAFGICCLLYYFFASKQQRFLTICKLAILSMIVIYSMTLFESTNSILERLGTIWNKKDSIVSSSDEGRIELIIFGLSLWLKNPWFGNGFDTYSLTSAHVLGFSTYSHNNYVELLATVGVFGFLAYYIPKIFVVWRLLKVQKKDRSGFHAFLLSVSILLLIFDMTIVSYYYFSLNFFWLFAYLYILGNPDFRINKA